MRAMNGWLTFGFVALVPVAHATGWVKSSIFISDLSLIALILGALSAWQAARVEAVQAEEAEEREANPVETKVVEKIVAETTIERSG